MSDVASIAVVAIFFLICLALVGWGKEDQA